MFEYEEESAYYGGRTKEDVVRAFIGRKASVMYPKLGLISFNPFTFISPIYYFIYRKCYISAAISYGIVYALQSLSVDNSTYSMLMLIFRIVAATMFYKIYQWEIMRRVDKWTAESKTFEEMETLAAHKGGTSILTVIIILVIELIITYIFYALIIGATGYSIYDILTI